MPWFSPSLTCLHQSVGGELVCPQPGSWFTGAIPWTGFDVTVAVAAGLAALAAGLLFLAVARRFL